MNSKESSEAGLVESAMAEMVAAVVVVEEQEEKNSSQLILAGRRCRGARMCELGPPSRPRFKLQPHPGQDN